MLLTLSPDQELFRETTAKYLGDAVPPAELRRLRDDPSGVDPAYWRQGGELGWMSMLVSERSGGGSISGEGLVDLTMLAHEFGSTAAPGPLLSCNVVATALDASGGHDDVLAAVMSGASIAAWCIAEPPPDDRLGALTFEITPSGDDVVLNGVKRPVESAGDASHLLVTGRTGEGVTQVLVPATTPGVRIAPLESLDLTRRFATVSFDDVRVPASFVVGEQGGAAAELGRQLDVAVAIACAESVGAMQAGYDLTLEWMFQRYSFGRPLASYQALKHRLADMTTWLQASHAISDAAIVAASTGSPDAPELLSAAKAFVGDYGSELLQECVQLHGGIGVTYEHDLHLYLRRHTVNRSLFGRPAEHRRRLAEIAVQNEAETEADHVSEDLEQFRSRARSFIRSSLREIGPISMTLESRSDEEELSRINREREVQRLLFEAGLAGICVPPEYGGQGLTQAHQLVLNEELGGYEAPVTLQIPTMSPCLAVLLDHGTEEQKQRHIPAILKGEELWLQFLSEPASGSDVAAARMTAVRDGDEWVLNGSKIWTTGAWYSDWGLCLARTNWDVPKHRGLTVFMFPIDQPGVEMHRIEMLSGNTEFCQEFLTDVRVPDTDRVGDVDQGWTVCTQWMFHERMLHNSPYVTIPVGTRRGGGGASLVEIAQAAGVLDDPAVRERIGEGQMLELVHTHLQDRVMDGVTSGALSHQAAAIVRLYTGLVSSREATLALDIAGSAGAAWDDDGGALSWCGIGFLMRQAGSIGGGTTEIARNVISERVLGMPREPSADRDVAFRDVQSGR